MYTLSRSSWSRSLLIALVVLPSLAAAQGRFTVNGRMKIEGADLSGARVVVMKNGTKERTITKDLTKFSLDLDLNANYVLSFEKDGYVAKKISFNTKAPAEAIANGFTPFDFAVSLFKQYDDINIVVFNQPVGMIRFDNKAGDFDYDTDYTKSIQSQLQQVLAQVEEKQKEEASSEKEKAVKAAEEVKALAKAEAEAAKQAAAAAKAEAEAKKQAEALAKLAEKKTVEAKPQPVVEKKQETAVAERTEAPAPTPAPKPKPKPVVVKPIVAAVSSKGTVGGDERRSLLPGLHEEPSRVAPAKSNVKEEQRPAELQEQVDVQRSEELLVEANKVTVVVILDHGHRRDEYRKAIHKWGGAYFFKNGATCSEEIYERETATEQFAGATPRGKLD